MQLKVHRNFIFIISFICTSLSVAESLRGSSVLKNENSNGYFFVGLETASISSSAGSALTGLGPRAGGDWALGKSWSVSPAVSFVTSTGGSYLYTGFNGSLRYTFFGNLVKSRQTLTRDGKLIYDLEGDRGSRLSGGVGIENLLLSGNQSSYSAAGPVFSLNYASLFWGKPFELSVKYSILSAKGINLTGMFINISYLFY